jgi:hypothetical protein
VYAAGAGRTLGTSDFQAGLLGVVDISDPRQPRSGRPLGGLLDGTPRSIADLEGILLVGSGGALTSIALPVESGETTRTRTPGTAMDIEVVDGGGTPLLYVADGDGGLLVLRAVSPDLPTPPPTASPEPPPTRRLTPVPTATATPSYSHRLFLPLVLYEAAAEAKPVTVRRLGSWGGPSRAVAADAERIYFGESSRVAVLDGTDPAAVRELGRTPDLGGLVFDLEARGPLVFVAASEAGLVILDVADPTRPSVLGRLRLPDAARGLAVDGSYAYVADGDAGLRIVDITRPEAPREVGWLDIPGRAWRVAVHRGHAYVASASYRPVTVVDVRDPRAPVQVSELLGELAEGGVDVTVSGDHAFVLTCEGCLEVFDISSPSEPRVLALADWSEVNGRSIEVVGSFAFVAGFGGLTVLDVSEPTAAHTVAEVPLDGGVLDMAVAGERV